MRSSCHGGLSKAARFSSGLVCLTTQCGVDSLFDAEESHALLFPSISILFGKCSYLQTGHILSNLELGILEMFFQAGH